MTYFMQDDVAIRALRQSLRIGTSRRNEGACSLCNQFKISFEFSGPNDESATNRLLVARQLDIPLVDDTAAVHN